MSQRLPLLLNDLVSFRSQGGIATYVKGIRSGLEKNITCFSKTALGFSIAKLSQFRKVKKSIQTDSSFEKLTHLFDFYLSKKRFQLFHEPDLIVPENIVPAVATVHDLSVLLTPEFHPPYRVKKYEQELAQSLRRTVHFLCNSEITRQDLVQHLKVPLEKTSVTPLAPGIAFKKQIKPPFALPSSYFLFVGTLEPRKNIPFLLDLFDSFPEKFKTQHSLVLIGNWGWQTEAIQKAFEKLKTPRAILHLQNIGDDYIGSVVKGAKALLFPSHSEGFGLPLLEAMQCETPVICSDIPIFKEVAGDAALFCSLKEPEAWKAAVESVLNDKNLVHELKEKAKINLEKYSWEKTCALTLEAYHKLLAAQVPATF